MVGSGLPNARYYNKYTTGNRLAVAFYGMIHKNSGNILTNFQAYNCALVINDFTAKGDLT